MPSFLLQDLLEQSEKDLLECIETYERLNKPSYMLPAIKEARRLRDYAKNLVCKENSRTTGNDFSQQVIQSSQQINTNSHRTSFLPFIIRKDESCRQTLSTQQMPVKSSQDNVQSQHDDVRNEQQKWSFFPVKRVEIKATNSLKPVCRQRRYVSADPTCIWFHKVTGEQYVIPAGVNPGPQYSQSYITPR